MLKSSFKIALIGSSGGGSGAVSASSDIIRTLQDALQGIQGSTVILHRVQFIVCDRGLDNINGYESSSKASLYSISSQNYNIIQSACMTLTEINHLASEMDKSISEDILSGHIDAIISISSDPGIDGIGVNQWTVNAGIQKNIPFVGTGGTSMSYIATSGGSIIGSSGGSIATTTTSRSLCFAASLASYWKVPYIYPRSKNTPWPLFRSICGGMIPIFVATICIKYCIHIILILYQYDDTSFNNIHVPNTININIVYKVLLHNCLHILFIISNALKNSIIPVTFTALTCLETSHLSELSLLAGSATGSLLSYSTHTNLIQLYTSGILTGCLLPYFLLKTSYYSFLPTAVSIVSIGVSSILSALIIILISVFIQLIYQLCWNIYLPHILSLLHPSIIYILNILHTQIIQPSFSLYLIFLGLLLGGICGYIVSWGSEHGYYHIIMLPILAYEMQYGNLPILGAYDVVCLCVPCAAVCAGVYVLSKTAGENNVTNLQQISATTTTTTTSTTTTTTEHHDTNCNQVDDTYTDKNNNNNSSNSNSNIDNNQKHMRLGWKGFISNVFYCDFVEACYPYTQPGNTHSSTTLLWMIRISCIIAGAILGLFWGYNLLQSCIQIIQFIYTSTITLQEIQYSNDYVHNVSSRSNTNLIDYYNDTLKLIEDISKNDMNTVSSSSSSSSWSSSSSTVRSTAYIPLPISILVTCLSEAVTYYVSVNTTSRNSSSSSSSNDICITMSDLSTNYSRLKIHLTLLSTSYIQINLLSPCIRMILAVTIAFIIPFISTLICLYHKFNRSYSDRLNKNELQVS